MWEVMVKNGGSVPVEMTPKEVEEAGGMQFRTAKSAIYACVALIKHSAMKYSILVTKPDSTFTYKYVETVRMSNKNVMKYLKTDYGMGL